MAQDCETSDAPAGCSIAAANHPGPNSSPGCKEGLSPGQLIEVWYKAAELPAVTLCVALSCGLLWMRTKDVPTT